MANGTYGTRRPASITSEDVDIYYYYRPSRSEVSPDFQAGYKKIGSEILSPCKMDAAGGTSAVLPGMFTLRLPLDKFGKQGIYSVYIKPREVSATIIDFSTLAFNDQIRGIVIDENSINGLGSGNDNGLTGYRIEYEDENGIRRPEYRIITSSNRCEPVAQNMNSSTANGVRYGFSNNSNLLFLTVSPSTPLSFKSDSIPYIGDRGDKIYISNTKFNPLMMEIEITDHDLETVTTMLEGTQIRNLDSDVITTFNKDGGIYHQALYGNMTNPDTGLNVDFKVRNEGVMLKTEEDRYKEVMDHLDLEQ